MHIILVHADDKAGIHHPAVVQKTHTATSVLHTATALIQPTICMTTVTDVRPWLWCSKHSHCCVLAPAITSVGDIINSNLLIFGKFSENTDHFYAVSHQQWNWWHAVYISLLLSLWPCCPVSVTATNTITAHHWQISSNHCITPVTLPARSCFSVSQTLQLKSSYPPIISRPLFENATDVMPQMMLSCEYMPISWSERMSNSRQVASSEPVAKANPLGKN